MQRGASVLGRRLAVLRGDAQAAASPVPTLPGQALYSRPNPDKTRKMCQNCIFWKAGADQCLLHDSDVMVVADSICWHHVFGQSIQDAVDADNNGAWTSSINMANMEPVEPQFSGLRQVPDGVSCDGCRHYEVTGQASGTCAVLADPEEPEEHFPVEPLASCARWEAADAEAEPEE
jgi:hypothetical protein